MLFLADEQVLEQLTGAGIAMVKAQAHAAAVPIDGVLLELPVQCELLRNGLADHDGAQPLHVGQRIQ